MCLIFSFSLASFTLLFIVSPLSKDKVSNFLTFSPQPLSLADALSQLLPGLVLALGEKPGKHEEHTKSDQKV